MSRIVLFGATGYTGGLAAEALVDRGAKPVLAARSQEKLDVLAERLGGLETQTADVARPDTVRALVERGDVLLTTVGPFSRYGEPAVQAAIASGAHYLDSTGEPPWIRAVFDRYGGGAQAAGCGLLTAFGADWVPGNLAGALALREAGELAVRVDVGYFATGHNRFSGGTAQSGALATVEPSFAWSAGRIVTERGARKLRSFTAAGKSRPAVSVGATEHYALPRIAPQLRDINVYLGWFGPASRPMQGFSLLTSGITRIPGARGALKSLVERTVKGSTGGPDAAERARGGFAGVAIAYDASGRELAEVSLEGVNGYTFTGNILAWGAETALAGGLQGTGALGPVDGFGLEALEDGCRQAGLARA